MVTEAGAILCRGRGGGYECEKMVGTAVDFSFLSGRRGSNCDSSKCAYNSERTFMLSPLKTHGLYLHVLLQKLCVIK